MAQCYEIREKDCYEVSHGHSQSHTPCQPQSHQTHGFLGGLLKSHGAHPAPHHGHETHGHGSFLGHQNSHEAHKSHGHGTFLAHQNSHEAHKSHGLGTFLGHNSSHEAHKSHGLGGFLSHQNSHGAGKAHCHVKGEKKHKKRSEHKRNKDGCSSDSSSGSDSD